MEIITRHAFQAAARDAALASLGALALMFQCAADPLSALKAGAIGFTLAAIFLVLRAARTDRLDVEGNEVWLNLKAEERPPLRLARRLIGEATRRASYTFAWHAAGVALSLWAGTIGVGLCGSIS